MVQVVFFLQQNFMLWLVITMIALEDTFETPKRARVSWVVT